MNLASGSLGIRWSWWWNKQWTNQEEMHKGHVWAQCTRKPLFSHLVFRCQISQNILVTSCHWRHQWWSFLWHSLHLPPLTIEKRKWTYDLLSYLCWQLLCLTLRLVWLMWLYDSGLCKRMLRGQHETTTECREDSGKKCAVRTVQHVPKVPIFKYQKMALRMPKQKMEITFYC